MKYHPKAIHNALNAMKSHLKDDELRLEPTSLLPVR